MAKAKQKRINRRPKPGVYPGTPFEVYESWPYVNNSSLKHAVKSAGHYQWALDHGLMKETASLRFGRLVHAIALEDMESIVVFDGPEWEDMKARYVRPTTTREWEYRVGKLRKKHGDVEVYSGDELERALGVVDAISLNPLASSYFRDCQREVSIVWDDPETQVRCKARLDAVGEQIVDLKTTDDASSFERAIRAYHYYRQLAFYRDGWATLNGGELLDACIVAVESDPFHGVKAAPLSDELLAYGREEYRVALMRIARAIDADRWDGYQNPGSWDFAFDDSATVLIDGKELRV